MAVKGLADVVVIHRQGLQLLAVESDQVGVVMHPQAHRRHLRHRLQAQMRTEQLTFIPFCQNKIFFLLHTLQFCC